MKLPVVLGVLAIATAVPAWMSFGQRTAATGTTAPVLGITDVNPGDISALAVYERDGASTTIKPFSVEKSGDAWVMPRYWNYPADANTRVSKIAAGFLGVATSRLVTADAARHGELGVLDPMDQNATAKEGFGKLVELKDRTGRKVLELVVGNRATSGEGMTYVRLRGQSEVYTAKVDTAELSTRFTDFVELDPFKIKRDDITRLAIVDYTLEENRGIIPRGTTPFTKTDAGEWQSPAAPEGKRAAKTAVEGILNQLTSMQLAGVRPFRLERLKWSGFYAIDPQAAASVPDLLVVDFDKAKAALFGKEGRLDITTRDGLRYSLMFGKIALSDEDDTDEKAGGETGGKDEAKPADSGSNRYLAVYVQYDATADEEVRKAAEEAAKKTVEKKDGDPKDEPKADQSTKPSGKERAAKAQARFQQFFYVISDSSFKALRPEIAKLFEDKPKEPMAGSTGKTNSQWLDENAAKPGIVKTASGLQYEVIASGPEGGRKPIATDQVSVAYKGKLIDGKVFDDSAKQPDGTATFGVNGVIKGWTEALQLMKEGDKWRLFIPSALAYGEAGQGADIPANSILIFEVELKKVLTPPATTPDAAAPTPAAEP